MILCLECDKFTIVIAYDSGENHSKESKDVFWEVMQEALERERAKVVVMGDLNGTMGTKDDGTMNMKEKVSHSNGRSIIEFCLMNNLLIENSFFQHKAIQKTTSWERNRDENSIYDFVVKETGELRTVKDIRGALK